MSRTASPATLDRRVRTVENEGVAQARMWLAHSELGPASIDAAMMVLVSTKVRVDTLRGLPLTMQLVES